MSIRPVPRRTAAAAAGAVIVTDGAVRSMTNTRRAMSPVPALVVARISKTCVPSSSPSKRTVPRP